MADIIHSTDAPEAERREHPTDVIGQALDKLDGLLNLLTNDFEPELESLKFVSGDSAIWQTILVCSDLVRQIDAAHDRLNNEYEVPMRSKAEKAALDAQARPRAA
jgi:hypothetical protein